MKGVAFAAGAVACAAFAAAVYAQQGKPSPKMSFFVTSAGSGNGADLGGLAGADKICQSLAQAAGAPRHTWHAYMSATAQGGQKAVNARERIGKGPWYNYKGELIARNVEELHTDNHITKQTALTERGQGVNGVGDKPTQHDMLTGSDSQGRAFPGNADTTCGNWTRSGEGSAQLGHSDRRGFRDDPPSHSWNDAHPSRGCSQQNLISTGGNGYFYCFAAR